MKKHIRKVLALVGLFCISQGAWAQYDYSSDVEDYSLDEVAEEKPQHKEYKNMVYMQYSPSQYLQPGTSHLHFQEFTLGYARSIQILDDYSYFIELGANIKYSYYNRSKIRQGASRYDLLTFRIPVNLVYKFYLSKTSNKAIAPFAGVYGRIIAAAEQKNQGGPFTFPRYTEDGESQRWDRTQLGWQAGVKFYLSRFYLGVSYSRDFPDDSKQPHIHESSVLFGVCF